jgi:hypothetical protein
VFSVSYWTFPGNGFNNGYSSASGSSPLFTVSLTELTISWFYPLLIISQHGPHRKHSPSIVVSLALLRIYCLATGMCLPSLCPETVLVYPPISRSLHSNSSTRYSIYIQYFCSVPCYQFIDAIWHSLPSAARLPGKLWLCVALSGTAVFAAWSLM